MNGTAPNRCALSGKQRGAPCAHLGSTQCARAPAGAARTAASFEGPAASHPARRAGRCSAACISMKRVPLLLESRMGAAWLARGKQAQASSATSPAPQPYLQRGQEERGQRLELLQARHVVPVIAHQEVAGPVGSKQGRLAGADASAYSLKGRAHRRKAGKGRMHHLRAAAAMVSHSTQRVGACAARPHMREDTSRTCRAQPALRGRAGCGEPHPRRG